VNKPISIRLIYNKNVRIVKLYIFLCLKTTKHTAESANLYTPSALYFDFFKDRMRQKRNTVRQKQTITIQYHVLDFKVDIIHLKAFFKNLLTYINSVSTELMKYELNMQI
jgi:hypothetical protein